MGMRKGITYLKQSPLTHLSIRAKLTLPYVLLALLIALGGGIIVTQVMIDSLEDRFTNQLIETRKLASELMVREEDHLLETLRLLSHTEGVVTKIAQNDRTAILQLVYPLTFNAGEDVVLVLDRYGNVIAAVLKTENSNEYEFPQIDERLNTLPFVARLVQQEVDEQGDKFSGVSRADWGTYFFVSGPVNNQSGDLVGVILVGRSLRGIAQTIREETLSQATIYDTELHAISSTFIEFPTAPDIKPELVVKTKDAQSFIRYVDIGGISYTEVLSTWEIRGGEDIGFLGTALPKTFIARASRVTRLNVTLQVVIAITAALLLGLSLSGLITRPILRLKDAAIEVSKGNLDIYVPTNGTDEVAVLARSFNEMAANLKRSEKNLIYAYDKTIEGWVKALELRDRETVGHTLRAANMTLELARLMNIDPKDMETIRRGVLLHDIGKMGIPDNILLKEGPLDDFERMIMQRHPVLAREMLSQIEFLHPCMDIPSYHHERWDGSGYPYGLAGTDIPVQARLFAVIDVWDALTSHRPYRQAWSEESTLEYIKDQAGKHFDPEVVSAFVKLIEKKAHRTNEEKTEPILSWIGKVKEVSHS
jgi:putative nucleotidyltransferase with HDIG domain